MFGLSLKLKHWGCFGRGGGVSAAPTTPVILSGDAFSTPENVLYSQTATASGGGTMTWAKGGTDAAAVTLNTATGEWSLTGDFETDASISFTLTATNSAGSSSPQTITVTITDVVEAGPTTPTLQSESIPELAHTPRAGEPWQVFGGEWDGANLYRIRLYRGATMFVDITNTAAVYEGTYASSEQNLVVTGTIEASSNSGTNWSAPVALEYNEPYPANGLIEKATRAPPTMTRISSSGTLPMVYELTCPDLYPTDRIEYVHTQGGITTIWRGTIDMTEGTLVSPFIVDLSGDTDPIPSSIPPDLEEDTFVSARVLSADHYADGDNTPYNGVASAYSNAIAPTDAAVPVRWDSVDKNSAVTLSSSDTVAEIVGNPLPGPWMVRANQGVESGQLRYFEVEITDAVLSWVCLVDDVPPLTDEWLPAGEGGTPTVHAINWHHSGTIAFDNGYTIIGTAGSHATLGSICGLYVNGATDRLYLTFNGTATVGDPVAGTGGIDISTLDFPMKPGLILGPNSAARLRAKSADLITTPLGSYLPLDPA